VSEPNPRSGETLYTNSFWLLCLAHIVASTTGFALLLLPRHIRQVGGDEIDIGLLAATASLAGIGIRPISGYLADRVGRRTVFLLGGLTASLSFLLYPYLESVHLPYYLVRILHAFGAGSLFNAFFTYAADISPRARRTEGIAIFGISGMLGGLLGPWLAEEILERSEFETLFFTLSLLSALSLILTLFLPRRSSCNEPIQETTSFRSLIINHSLGTPWLVGALFGFGLGTIFTFLEPLSHSRNIQNITSYMGWYCVSASLLRIFGRRLPDRLGPPLLLPPCLISFSLSALLLSHAQTVTDLAVAGALGGLGHGFVFPILLSVCVNRSPEKYRGRVIALITISIDSGGILAGPLSALVIRNVGYPEAFHIASGICLLGAILFLACDRTPSSPPSS
jgi:MFS family permease